MLNNQTHIVILGPPAVGKLTVSKELSRITGFPVFDNAKTVDLVSLIHKYGTNEFRVFRDYLRYLFYSETLLNSKINGLISTNVLRHPSNWMYFKKVENIFKNNGWETKYIILTASCKELQKRVLSKNRKFKYTLTSKESLEIWIYNNPFHTMLKNCIYPIIETTDVNVEEIVIEIMQILNG